MDKRWITTILAGVLGATTLAAPAAAASHPCARATTRCEGTVRVPLDWTNPGSESLAIPFVLLPQSGERAAGVIAALPGGPGSVLGQLGLFENKLGPLRTGYGLLIVERRGFGDAGRLHCEHVDVRVPETIEACAGDPRMQYFTTDQRVADINAVRAALGIEKLTLYGISYGSIEGPAFAARFPRHVAAGIFDSPSMIADPRTGHTPGFTYQDELNNNLGGLDDACQRSKACRALPGDTVGRVARVAEMLRTSPDPKVRIDQLTMITKFLDPMTPREANAALDAYINGDRAPLHRLAALDDYVDDPNQLLRNVGIGFLAFICNDMAWPFDRRADTETRKRQVAEHRAKNPEHPLTTRDVAGDAGLLTEWCSYWPTPRDAPTVPPNAEYPDVPVLTIAGTFDWNAAENAVTLANRFRDGRALVVRYSGHSTSQRPAPTYETCVAQAIHAFITHPHRPTPRCSGENFKALGRFPVTSGDPLTTVFQTAMDALTSRIPNTLGVITRTEMPGLRGGRVVFDQATARLEQVRYTEDAVVDGEIRFTADQATADLTLDGSRFRMSWRPFEAEEVMTVWGSRDGRPFIARLATG